MPSHPTHPSGDLRIFALIGVVGVALLIALPIIGSLIFLRAYQRAAQNSLVTPPASVVSTSTVGAIQAPSSTAPQILSIRLEGAQLSHEGAYGIRSGVPVTVVVQALNAKTVDMRMVPQDLNTETKPLGDFHKQSGGVYTLVWTPVGELEAEIEVRVTADDGTTTSHRIQVAVIK